jgi:hypothetical protein
MAAKTISVSEVATVSSTPSITVGHSSSVANSYPQDFERALEELTITLTSNTELEKAFKRAGLK